MSDPNYMKERLLLSELAKEQYKSRDLEMTLVHRLMERNGWDFPSGNDDRGDYNTAVRDVKWFVEQLLDLAASR